MAKLRALAPDTPIWITGHSLGAAVGTVFAGQLAGENIGKPGSVTIGGLYNFGSPRVGDAAFRDLLNGTHSDIKALGAKWQAFPIIRVRNNADPVTVIPSIGYHHAGTLLYFGSVFDTAQAGEHHDVPFERRMDYGKTEEYRQLDAHSLGKRLGLQRPRDGEGLLQTGGARLRGGPRPTVSSRSTAARTRARSPRPIRNSRRATPKSSRSSCFEPRWLRPRARALNWWAELVVAATADECAVLSRN